MPEMPHPLAARSVFRSTECEAWPVEHAVGGVPIDTEKRGRTDDPVPVSRGRVSRCDTTQCAAAHPGRRRCVPELEEHDD